MENSKEPMFAFVKRVIKEDLEDKSIREILILSNVGVCVSQIVGDIISVVAMEYASEKDDWNKMISDLV